MTRGIPVDLTSFVGRRDELAEGRRLLLERRLVTLIGPGGVGKTRLALHIARRAERRFADGAVLVELVALHDREAVLTAAAAALGLDTRDSSAASVVPTYLRHREVLLILDSCEHLVTECADLVHDLLAAAPGLRVLATSRQQLSLDGEGVMVIEPLPVPTADDLATETVSHVASVALLTDRAREVDPSFRVDHANVALVAGLCRALDGIPLAIELAAPRLRAFSLAQLTDRLTDRLDDRFRMLSATSRSTPQRHQTLHAMVEWSHELCSPEEQALWARLSVFEGGADLPAVLAVSTSSEEQTVRALAGLQSKSVVSAGATAATDGPPRYHMLETVRRFGADRLEELGDTLSTRDRHGEHFARLAQESRCSYAGPDQLGWVTRIRTDLSNFRAAFGHALSREPGRRQALVMASCLGWYWSPAGALEEGADWFARALAEDHEPSPLLLHTLAAALILAGDRADVATATELAARAIDHPYRPDHPSDVAAHEIAVATRALVSGDYELAEAAYRQALAAYRAAHDLFGQLEAVAMAGLLAGRLGRTDEALTTFSEGERLCIAHGEMIMRGQLLDYMGDLLLRVGRGRDALVPLRRALLHWPLLRTSALSSVLGQIARIYSGSGRHEAAAALHGARDRLWQEAGLSSSPFEADAARLSSREQLIEALGAERYDATYAVGLALTRQEAVALASDVETVGPPPTGEGGVRLTKREREVAEGLARGLSNKQIAELLVISPRTAEGHVKRVLDKLGVHSRGEAARRWHPAPPS